MAQWRRRRAPNDGGSIDQRVSGRWRLRVRIDDRQVTYGTYETEEEAVRAQARCAHGDGLLVSLVGTKESIA